MIATKELYVKARPVLDRVLVVTRERQNELVSEECANDEPLARLVRSLLRHRDNLVTENGTVDALNVLSVSIDDEDPPESLGSYRIIRRIGAGGMSVVYLAEQSNPKRLVALKVLRGTVSAAVLQHEVETLSRLRHPGIAQVYEAGLAASPDGPQPFFVMEFVSATGETETSSKGAGAQTIVDYVAERISWSVRDRLELVARVCDAVSYAHQRGVIHRDLKPTNILVDHLGHPKVIDFGIAMFAGHQDTEKKGAQGRIIAGTPPYMSPEQKRGDSTSIDLRSDVFALGVLAYELLTGSLPGESVTINRVGNADVTMSDAPVDAAPHSRSLPVEVSAILSKAMAPELGDRYGSAEALADDLRHFVAKRPVSARRNTIAYRSLCLFRRRPVICTSVALATLLISTSGLKAYRESKGAEEALALLVKGMEHVDPISMDGSPVTLERMLDAVGSDLDAHTGLHPKSAGTLHVVLGSLYLRQDARGRVGVQRALAHYGRGVELFEQAYGRSHAKTIQAKNNLGMAMSISGDAEGAAKLFAEVLVLRRGLGDARGVLVTRGNYAVALLRQKRVEEALTEFSEVFEGFVAIKDLRGALIARGWEARAYMDVGLLERAEDIQREVLKRSLAHAAFDDVSLALFDGFTLNLIYQKRWPEARKALGDMRELLKGATAEHKLNRAYFRKMGFVLQQLDERDEYSAIVKEFDDWEAKYGLGPA